MDNSTSSQKITPLKKTLLLLAQIVLACLAVGIAAKQIGKYTDSLSVESLAGGVPWLITAGGMYVVFYGVLAAHWQYISLHIEPRVSKYQWIAFFAAQPYKYLPSSIFTLTFRAKYARKLGMSIKKSSLAQFVENVSMLASATSMATFGWLFIHGYTLLGVGAFLACLIGFVLGFEILSRVKYGIHFSIAKRLTIFLLSLTGWIVAGAAFYVVGKGLGEDSGLIEALGANAAAFEAGIIAIFAPGGVGVRELVFGFFGVGALSIIAWRLVTAVVDVAVGPLAWLAIQKISTRDRN